MNPFIDENRYIRLNISWGDPVGKLFPILVTNFDTNFFIENFTSFDLDIDTNCSALYGSRNIPVEVQFECKSKSTIVLRIFLVSSHSCT